MYFVKHSILIIRHATFLSVFLRPIYFHPYLNTNCINQAHLESGVRLGPAHHVIDVANVLKLFFRELPEPLLAASHTQDALMRCLLGVGERRVHALLLSVLLLPALSLGTLAYFVQFLQTVSRHADRNRMTSENLAIIFAPGLMPLPEIVPQRLDSHCRVIRLLIEQAHQIGTVPPYIADRVRRVQQQRQQQQLEAASAAERAQSQSQSQSSSHGRGRSKSMAAIAESADDAESSVASTSASAAAAPETEKKKKKRRSGSLTSTAIVCELVAAWPRGGAVCTDSVCVCVRVRVFAGMFNGLRKIVGSAIGSTDELDTTPEINPATPCLTKTAKKRKGLVDAGAFSAKKK